MAGRVRCVVMSTVVAAATLAVAWWAVGTRPGSTRVGPGDATLGADVQGGRVERVVDGDTVDVAGVGRIRLIGIDAPERTECGFVEAADHVSRLTLGQQVLLRRSEGQPDADRYGRALRYVLVDGVDVGLSMIERGLAVARYDSRDGYGRHDQQATYVRAERSAPTNPGCRGP